MKKQLIILVIFMGLSLMGCGPMEEKPPKVMIQTEKDNYELTIGSYCWGDTCSDVAGSVEQLLETEEKKPIKVKPGQTISFVMKNGPKPNEISVIQENDNQELDVEVKVKDNQISASMEEGIYYYIYDVRWANGDDAFYPFALEVEVD
ncbi:hypothetical protein K7T73_21815 (plasmid) [Bacillus badius]|uniref:hypothetical protein n=1 Tax=Bacillus badius TaxID=1455 RepID=UPI001CBF1FAC|nr:hypothetical protein [Bacillus badius]UAT33111.1 hypothetical protein K7T73_21815 [Bacillus badius]